MGNLAADGVSKDNACVTVLTVGVKPAEELGVDLDSEDGCSREGQEGQCQFAAERLVVVAGEVDQQQDEVGVDYYRLKDDEVEGRTVDAAAEGVGQDLGVVAEGGGVELVQGDGAVVDLGVFAAPQFEGGLGLQCVEVDMGIA